jgi:hypothetical protein
MLRRGSSTSKDKDHLYPQVKFRGDGDAELLSIALIWESGISVSS